MIKRIVPSCLVAAVLMLMITGCWGRREMNDISIVAGLGIDQGTHKKYKVSLQVINPGGIAARKGTETSSPIYMFQGEGNTVFEAFRRITNRMPRKGYFSHTNILVIGEKTARKGIGELLDVISRLYEFRTDFYIVIAKDAKAEDILKVNTPLERVPVTKIMRTLEMSQREWAGTVKVTYDQLISELMRNGKHPVITGIRLKGSKTQGNERSNLEMIDIPDKLILGELAVFKNDRLIGWLNENQIKGYNYIRNEVERTVGTIPCPGGGFISEEVTKSNLKLKSRLIDGKPYIDATIHIVGNIVEATCPLDLTQQKTRILLEEKGEEKITSIIMESVHYAQKEFKADIFGFGQVFHRQHPKYWKTAERNWDEVFSEELTVKVHAKNEFQQTGSVFNSYLEKLMKEKEDQNERDQEE